MTEPTLRQRAIALYTPPFRYSGLGYVVDGSARIVADVARLEHSFEENEELGAIIAEALNAFWAANTAPHNRRT